jgi:hypothetical protein
MSATVEQVGDVSAVTITLRLTIDACSKIRAGEAQLCHLDVGGSLKTGLSAGHPGRHIQPTTAQSFNDRSRRVRVGDVSIFGGSGSTRSLLWGKPRPAIHRSLRLADHAPPIPFGAGITATRTFPWESVAMPVRPTWKHIRHGPSWHEGGESGPDGPAARGLWTGMANPERNLLFPPTWKATKVMASTPT